MWQTHIASCRVFHICISDSFQAVCGPTVRKFRHASGWTGCPLQKSWWHTLNIYKTIYQKSFFYSLILKKIAKVTHINRNECLLYNREAAALILIMSHFACCGVHLACWYCSGGKNRHTQREWVYDERELQKPNIYGL